MNAKSVVEKVKSPLSLGREGLVWLGKGALTKTLDFVDSRFADDAEEKDTASAVLHTVEEISQEPGAEQRKDKVAKIAELLMREAEVVCHLKGELLTEATQPTPNELIRKLYNVVRYFAETPREDAIELVRSEQVAEVINKPVDLIDNN